MTDAVVTSESVEIVKRYVSNMLETEPYLAAMYPDILDLLSELSRRLVI